MLDLIVRRANVIHHKTPVDITCKDGKIVEIAANIEAQAIREIDAAGRLVTPPFVDSHFHMDATMSLGFPRMNISGTLFEGIEVWDELKSHLTVEKVKERALELLNWSIARGTLAIRTHVDICDPNLIAVDALLEVREEMKAYVDMQLVAFPQDGYLRSQGAVELLAKALEKGVDVIGGIPHFERTMADGTASIKALCELATKRGLLVDMHCDETDDPLSRHIETLTYEIQRLGLQGRVAASHLTSMHSMDNYYVTKLLPLMAEAQVNCVCNPHINIVVQGRQDNYPKRRGLMRVPELIESGINVSFGHDCVMDPWYPLGTHDMLEVAHVGLHCLQMTGVEQIRAMFDCITKAGAQTLCLEKYGLEPGCFADMVILQAADPVEAIRLQPTRLYVIRRGEVIAETAPLSVRVMLENKEVEVDFTRQDQPG
ncbi:MAG: amidohydrolase family protein [Proteobacteria bacterium]|nr:amidohydrolase family protein [Pseudomonadota bacterium]NIS71216.1 amidohydrolase family protein [Pseudomonadota bacterium]